MNLGKRVLAVSLAAGMVTMPIAVMAEKVTSEAETNIVQSEEKSEYKEFVGTIKSTNFENGKGTILVDGKNESIVFHINDNVLVTDMKPTRENKIANLEEGVKVNVFYPSNTPVALSLPAQLTPEVVVVNNGNQFVKVDKFDDKLRSSDNKLILNVENKEEAEKYKNKNLLVYYSISTESLPIHATPNFVTILEDKKVEEEKSIGKYTRYEGKIDRANLSEDNSSVTVDTEDGKVVFHISKDTLVTDMRPTFENKMSHLVKGQDIIIFSKTSNPVTASLPPQLTPEVIVVNNGDQFVKVDKFDENLISSDNKLQLNLKDESDKKRIKNKDVLVYYKESTKSIPAKTTPLSYVVLGEKQVESSDVTVLDKIMVNGKEVKINMYKRSNGTVMLPIRDLSKALGYDVKWVDNSKPIEITKGAHWSSIEIGKDNYTFAKKAPFKLGQAPELKNGITYVPYKFISEVMKVENVEIDNGLINIK